MMEGETSPNTVTGGIFDGEPELDFDEPTEGEETEEREDAQEPVAEAKEPEKADEESDFLTIRYNKADVKLSRAEAVELAQKGKNYDHVFDELKSYREGPVGRAMKAYADEAGMTVEQYAELMISNKDAADEKAAMDKMEEEHPDWPEDAIRELVKAQRAGAKEQAKSAEEQKRQREWAEAHAAYPDITFDNLPQDVQEAVANGAKPLEALRLHELAELRAQVAKLTAAQETKQKQEDNRARSIGSAAGVSSGGDEQDDFLAGMASRVRS